MHRCVLIKLKHIDQYQSFLLVLKKIIFYVTLDICGKIQRTSLHVFGLAFFSFTPYISAVLGDKTKRK